MRRALPLTYVLDPTSDLDGVVVDVPLPLLDAVASGPGSTGRCRAAGSTWSPRSSARCPRTCVGVTRRPARPPPTCCAHHGPTDGPLLDVVAAALTERGGLVVQPHHLDQAAVPDHLRVTYRAVDDGGRPLAWSKDLPALRRRLAERVREALATASPIAEVHGATSWTFGTIPRHGHGHPCRTRGHRLPRPRR